MSEIEKIFKNNDIIPDVMNCAPETLLKVTFDCGAVVDKGNELSPKSVKNQPNVEWDADPNTFYTIIMTDPDAPSRNEPKYREYQHWVVTNIPGNDISRGDVLTAYVGSGPPKGTGLHRYVFQLYKQPGRITFAEEKIPKTSGKGRANFKASKFSKKYKLDAIGANFYKSQWDEYVPTLHKQLSGK